MSGLRPLYGLPDLVAADHVRRRGGVVRRCGPVDRAGRDDVTGREQGGGEGRLATARGEARHHWQSNGEWQPAIDADQRAAVYRQWNRAVERSYGWPED